MNECAHEFKELWEGIFRRCTKCRAGQFKYWCEAHRASGGWFGNSGEAMFAEAAQFYGGDKRSASWGPKYNRPDRILSLGFWDRFWGGPPK